MSGNRGQPEEGWERAKEVWKRARVTAEIVAPLLNPLAGPVAQQAHLLPAMDPPAINREIDRDQQKQYAEWEIEQRREEAGRVIRETGSRATRDETGESRAAPRQESSRSRDRQPGHGRARS